MRPVRSIGVTAGALLVVVALIAPAAGTALVPNPALDQTGKGLTIAEAGVGLADLGNGTKNINITIGGPVQKAFLYWAGRQSGPCAGLSCLAGRDQTLVFDGTSVAGTQTGTEQGVAEFTNVGYKADVTAIVAAKGGGAAKTFTIADGDALDLTVPTGAGLNGAGLFVIYRNLADNVNYRVMVYEGLDFAWQGGATLELRNTTPVVFNHGATTTSRNAQVVVFAGDASPTRPDRITVNGTTFNNLLDANPDGPQWDTELISVTIAANVASTAVRLFSDPPPAIDSDSLLWQLGALRVPVPGGTSGGCTPGYWKNHHNSWAPTGYSPAQKVNTVFTVPGALAALGNATLDQALAFGGGSGTIGGAQNLLRAAVASLLNSASPGVTFGQSTAQVINSVNAALATNNRATMLALAGQLDRANNGRCTLN